MFYTTQPLESNKGLKQLFLTYVRNTIKRDVLPVVKAYDRVHAEDGLPIRLSDDRTLTITDELPHGPFFSTCWHYCEQWVTAALDCVSYCLSADPVKNPQIKNSKVWQMTRSFDPQVQAVLGSDCMVLVVDASAVKCALIDMRETDSSFLLDLRTRLARLYQESAARYGSWAMKSVRDVVGPMVSQFECAWLRVVHDVVLRLDYNPDVSRLRGTHVRSLALARAYGDMLEALRVAFREVSEYANQNSL